MTHSREASDAVVMLPHEAYQMRQDTAFRHNLASEYRRPFGTSGAGYEIARFLFSPRTEPCIGHHHVTVLRTT